MVEGNGALQPPMRQTVAAGVRLRPLSRRGRDMENDQGAVDQGAVVFDEASGEVNVLVQRLPGVLILLTILGAAFQFGSHPT